MLSQIRRKRIGKHHDVSVDGGQTWSHASDFDELFVLQGRSSNGTSPHLWHYVFDNKKLGPVTEEEVRLLITSGSMSGRDLVWNNSLPEWVPVSQVPAFANSVPMETERATEIQVLPSRQSLAKGSNSLILSLFSLLFALLSLPAVASTMSFIAGSFRVGWKNVSSLDSVEFFWVSAGGFGQNVFPIAASVVALMTAHHARQLMEPSARYSYPGTYARLATTIGIVVLFGAILTLFVCVAVLLMKTA